MNFRIVLRLLLAAVTLTGLASGCSRKQVYLVATPPDGGDVSPEEDPEDAGASSEAGPIEDPPGFDASSKSCESRSAPSSTSETCSLNESVCPEECGGGQLYGCDKNGAAPVGLRDCYTIVVSANIRWTCCPQRACTRHAASDSLCPGKKAFFCPADRNLPGCTSAASDSSFRCCP